MKIYKARPGVVLLTVCGEHLLVATGQARGQCPDITQINEAGADFWRIILEEGRFDRVLARVQSELELPSRSAFPALLAFLSKLTGSGYLISEDAV